MRISANELGAVGFGNFYEIEFKIKLERGGTNGEYTPMVRGLTVSYEDNLNS